jgi:F0F1-type ATP synthase assembly protein I
MSHEREREPRRVPTPGRKSSLPVSGAEFAGIGLQFALTIVVFMFGGIWLDKHLKTSPWFVIICVFAGAGGGFYSIYRRVMAAQQRHDQDRR